MSTKNIVINSVEISQTQLNEYLNSPSSNPYVGVQKLIGLLRGGMAGTRAIQVIEDSSASIASGGNIAISGSALTNGDTVSISQVSLTAVTSAPAANQFAINSNGSVVAVNLYNAITANASLTSFISAATAPSAVTISAVSSGYAGNAIMLSASSVSSAFILTQVSGGSAAVTIFNLL